MAKLPNKLKINTERSGQNLLSTKPCQQKRS